MYGYLRNFDIVGFTSMTLFYDVWVLHMEVNNDAIYSKSKPINFELL